MHIRPFHPLDTAGVVAVYRDAVLSIGPQQYSPQQVKVWAKFAQDNDAFRDRLMRGRTLVAITHKKLVAFGQLDPLDHIALLYTAGRHARKGIATAILQALEDHAKAGNVTHLDTDASRISRPFFEMHGYEVIQTQEVLREGVSFERFKMGKNLTAK